MNRAEPPASPQARAFTQPVSTGLGYPQTPNSFGGVEILYESSLAEILHVGKSIRHSKGLTRGLENTIFAGSRGAPPVGTQMRWFF
jgi:hypothetical protein